MKSSKSVLEKVLEERSSLVKTLEDELKRNKQQLERWEKEVARLEGALGNKENNTLSIKGEFERVREQRVDDAMMIDRMRAVQSDAIAIVNQIVGKVINYLA